MFNCKWDGTQITFVLNQDQKAIVRVSFIGSSVRQLIIKREGEHVQHWRTCQADADGEHLPGGSVGEVGMEAAATYTVTPGYQYRSCPPDSGMNHTSFMEAFETPRVDYTDTSGKLIFIRSFVIGGPLLSDAVSITIMMEDNTGGGE
jgi:hypothetical protein